MVAIRYADGRVELGEGESVLDGLTRHGVPVPSSCRSGLCQTCLLRAVEGTPPAAAQRGLKDSLKLQKHFLACLCHPAEDLTVTLPTEAPAAIPATVRGLDRLTEDILQVTLECHAALDYRPGQFVSLLRGFGLSRSYSIASVPEQDAHLHLHVRKLAGGRMSGWIHEELRPGQTVELVGPAGDCFYVPGNPGQPLLLMGTGSGLAPLYGIVRDALGRGHTGPIRLFHGSRDLKGIYLAEELRALAGKHPHFEYVPCLSGPEVPPGFAAGRAHEVALAKIPSLRNWRLFLCGHPDMVKQARKRAFLAGAAMKDIYADAFHVGPAAPAAA
jgi:ferredoxin-NADP reductase/ferredoxin